MADVSTSREELWPVMDLEYFIAGRVHLGQSLLECVAGMVKSRKNYFHQTKAQHAEKNSWPVMVIIYFITGRVQLGQLLLKMYALQVRQAGYSKEIGSRYVNHNVNSFHKSIAKAQQAEKNSDQWWL